MVPVAESSAGDRSLADVDAAIAASTRCSKPAGGVTSGTNSTNRSAVTANSHTRS
jgi:hypothetical protein